ncbi:MAG TPA: hypothetical protein PLP19_13780 [bacterium]|nr:hypothetical protein [bacterium]HPN44557.1 hypothetical protein [bacterium]
MKNLTRRQIFTIILISITVIIHLVGLARFLNDKYAILYRSYFSDIIIPFCFYFIVSIAKKLKIPRTRIAYFLFVFISCVLAETGQYFGLPILGRTFDYLDIGAYLSGTASAIIVDILIFGKDQTAIE